MDLKYIQVYIVSMSILIIVLFHIKKFENKFLLQNKLFIALIYTTAVTLTADTFGWILDGTLNPFLFKISYLSEIVLFSMNIVPLIIWILYLDYQIFNDVKRLKITLIPVIFLFVFCFIPTILTPWTDMAFYFDEYNGFHRGYFFTFIVIPNYLLFIYGFLLIIFNKKKISSQIFIPLLSFSVPPLIATTLQIIFYGIPLIWSGVTISLLIVYINIQSRIIGTDFLTGLNNRRQLDLYLEALLKKTNKIIALIMIDVDKFKTINDTFGHKTGDKALEHCAYILRKCFHYNDFIARYAGDEFVVVLELNSKNDIEFIVKRLFETTEKLKHKDNAPYNLSLSVGYSIYPDEEKTLTSLFQKADDRMYENKKSKKESF